MIKVNGEEMEIGSLANLKELVESQGYNPQLVVCEVNLEIVSREKLQDRGLEEGDEIEIVTFMQGG
jgi:thiamine biosynthesis protein ThiS